MTMTGTSGPSAWSSDVTRAGGHAAWTDRLPADFPAAVTADARTAEAARRIWAGERLSEELALRLLEGAPLPALGALALAVKVARFGDDVFFNLNLHVNPTNICVLACRFCAFRRGPRAADAYALSVEDYLAAIEPHAEVIDEVHSVGGLHPDWTIEHYEALFSAARQRWPDLHVKALTAVELKHIAERSGLDIRTTLTRLQQAGLGSLPGGGAEILDDGVRDLICRGKESSEDFLTIHRTAHELGLPTNATMLFGTVDSLAMRVHHLERLRRLQDETAGFQCFVPYPFLADNTRVPEAQLATSTEVLRTIAISRLMLDNIPHIKSYRMNLGDCLAALALLHGADDVDGTVAQESIMHEAGATSTLDLDREALARLVREVGAQPVQRNTVYTRFRRHLPPPPSGRERPLPLAGVGAIPV